MWKTTKFGIIKPMPYNTIYGNYVFLWTPDGKSFYPTQVNIREQTYIHKVLNEKGEEVEVKETIPYGVLDSLTQDQRDFLIRQYREGEIKYKAGSSLWEKYMPLAIIAVIGMILALTLYMSADSMSKVSTQFQGASNSFKEAMDTLASAVNISKMGAIAAAHNTTIIPF